MQPESYWQPPVSSNNIVGSLSAIPGGVQKIPEPAIPEVGDKLLLVFNAFGGLSIHNPKGFQHYGNESFVEVEVTAIKKAKLVIE